MIQSNDIRIFLCVLTGCLFASIWVTWGSKHYRDPNYPHRRLTLPYEHQKLSHMQLKLLHSLLNPSHMQWNISRPRINSSHTLHNISQPHLNLSRSSNLKIIAYSLYGDNPRYTDGAFENARLISEFFPEWVMRVYYDRSVPEAVLKYLRDHKTELIDMSNDTLKNQMVWRFLPAADTNVERFISRDVDSRLSKRDAEAVKEWVESGLPFHVLRDHPSHSNFAVSGGMWGSKGGAVKDIRNQLEASSLSNEYLEDMNFLNYQIWPLMNETGVMVHDSFSCDRVNTRPFPSARNGLEHVGSVYIDGVMRESDTIILMNAITAGNATCDDQKQMEGLGMS